MSLRKINKNMIDDIFVQEVSSLNDNIQSVTQALADTVEEVTTGIFARKSITPIKKAVVFIDDDGRSSTFTRLKPIADEKGIKFSFCIVPPWIGTENTMTWNQVKQLVAEGHDVHGHSMTHRQLALIPPAELDEELGACKRAIQAQGLTVNHFVYPGGSYDKTVADATRKHYKSGIAIASQENYKPIEQYVVRRYDLDGNNLSFLKSKVDVINAKEGLLVFMMHTWNAQWNPAKEQELRDLIDYVKSLSIPIMNFDEAFEHFGNVIDIGSKAEGRYLKVDQEGNIYNQNYDTIAGKRYPRNTVKFATPPSYFGKNEMSITDFNAANSEFLFPEKREGVLRTENGWDAAQQYWYPYQSDNIYRRRSHNTSDAWLAFQKVDDKNYSRLSVTNAYSVTSTFEDFPNFEEQITYINSAHPNLASFPNGQPGKLISDRTANNDRGSFRQQYLRYNSILRYERFMNPSGIFSPFYMQAMITPISNHTLIFGDIPAHSSKDLDVTVEGVVYGNDMAVVNPHGTILAGLVLTAMIKPGNIVVVRMSNITATAITVPSQLFKLTVIKS